MVACIGRGRGVGLPTAVLASFLLLSPSAHAQTAAQLLGGPHGVVKAANGNLLEGMMVQLIAQKSAIRTTVYSDADGRYAFPRLEPGAYTLRIAQPREFVPYKKAVEIDGANELADITLERLTPSEVLPSSAE